MSSVAALQASAFAELLSPAMYTYGILLLGLTQSTAIWCGKSWRKRDNVDFEAVAFSDRVPLPALLAYRLACAVWVFYVQWQQLFVLQATPRTLCFYTTWCWITLGIYFSASALASLQALYSRRTKQSRAGILTSNRYAAAVSSLLHLNCTTVLIVDVVFWTILMPMHLSNKDPKMVEFYRRVFFSFASYNQHIVNAFMIYIELCINKIPFAFHNISIVGAFSFVYAIWGIFFHHLTGDWLYPFLNTDAPLAPAWYAGLYAAHWAFYGLFAALASLRQKLPAACNGRQTRQAAQAPKLHAS